MSTLYSTLKFLRFTDRLEAVRERKLIAPVHIRIKPMNHCNHDCWYCAYRVSNLSLGADMDTRDKIPEQKMFEIVDDIVDMQVKAVTFSGGGEPLLYKPLPEVIERLTAGGVNVGSLTNGSGLKGRVAEVFAEHAKWVRISMEGWDGPSYAKARGIKEDAFEKLIKNMRDFTALKSNCVLGVSLIVGADNYQHIHELSTLLKDIGVNHVKLSAVVVSNDGKENNDYHKKIMQNVSSQIEKIQSLATPDFTVLDHYHTLDERFHLNFTICPNIQFNPVIGGDSVVYTCHDKAFNKAGAIGSIADRSFKDLWFSKEASEKVYAINPSIHCKHHCADQQKILAMHEYLDIDQDHGVFV